MPPIWSAWGCVAMTASSRRTPRLFSSRTSAGAPSGVPASTRTVLPPETSSVQSPSPTSRKYAVSSSGRDAAPSRSASSSPPSSRSAAAASTSRSRRTRAFIFYSSQERYESNSSVISFEGAAVSRLTTKIAIRPQTKPGTISYRSKMPPESCAQTRSTMPPTRMPA